MKFFLFSSKEKNILKETDKILEVIKIGNKEVICAIGGGGKTHTVFEICKELWEKKSKKVALCTTTHMMFPSEEVNVYEGDKPEEVEKLFENSFVICGSRDGRRMAQPPQFLLDKLPEICDFLVIEADGSRQLPLKFPQQHEPVLHPKTTLVIGICGIDAYGKTIKDVCHRSPTAVKVLGKTETDIVTAEDIAKTLESKECGQMKGVECRFIPLINKVDDEEKKAFAISVASCLKENEICLFSSYV